MRGIGATSLGPIFTGVIQLVSVPVLMHFWGAAKYGDWLLLSAIPTYLTLTDLGLGDASASDMTMRVGANDRDEALCTFQSAWVLVTSISLVMLLLALVSVWWIPWQHWLKLSGISSKQAARVILVLGAYVIASQQNGITESGYRSDGYFATGTFWMAILRLVEAALGVVVAVLGGGLLMVACTYLLVRLIGTIAYAALLLRLSPWIRYGVRHVSWGTIRQLAAPGFGFMVLPLGYVFSLQGLTMVIGARLGPIAVVSFSTLRTLSRVSLQLASIIKHTLWPELSRAFGAADIPLARGLHRRACQAALSLSALCGLFLWVFGPHIYRFWVRDGVPFDATCFHALLLVAVTSSLWDMSSVIPISTNGHFRIALIYSALSLLSLGLAWTLAPSFGTVGAAIAVLSLDVFMTWLVLRTALYNVRDNLKQFISAIFTIPDFRQIFRPVPGVQTN
jgi:O-antigen/teichoic acid export membrane protein